MGHDWVIRRRIEGRRVIWTVRCRVRACAAQLRVQLRDRDLLMALVGPAGARGRPTLTTPPSVVDAIFLFTTRTADCPGRDRNDPQPERRRYGRSGPADGPLSL